MGIIKKIEEVRDTIDLFLVQVLQNNDNLVIDNQDDNDDVIVFSSDINWKWSNDNLNIHIRDRENQVNIQVDNVEEDEDEDDLDTIYLNDYMLTVL